MASVDIEGSYSDDTIHLLGNVLSNDVEMTMTLDAQGDDHDATMNLSLE